MPSIFRSEDVDFCQIVIPVENAYNIIKLIGELECIQFIDKNKGESLFGMKFTQNIIWCDEIHRKLQDLNSILKSDKLAPLPITADHDAPNQRNFSEFEQEINSVNEQIKVSTKNVNDLNSSYNELRYYNLVLKLSAKIDTGIMQSSGESVLGNIGSVYGVVPRFRASQFEQFLWRACRGNVLFRTLSPEEEFYDLLTRETTTHCIFVVYIQGDLLQSKVKKICEVFNVPIFSVPDTKDEREKMSVALTTRVQDLEIILRQTLDQRKLLIDELVKNLNVWKLKILKIKAIFVTLNMFHYDTGSHTLVAEAWCPRADVDRVRDTLNNDQSIGSNDLGVILNVVKSPRTPPTYFRTTRFTRGFQNLVDAYGIAKYKEINPSLFMIITFPFLFSVMFGDFGHAIVLVLFSAYIVIREKYLSQYKHMEMFDMLYAGRYIILLMGIFSLYSGFIYNDILSKSVYIFTSGWNLPSENTNPSYQQVLNMTSISPNNVELSPATFAKSDPYAIGLDPIWMFASNRISFINSFKMKLSIILGFFHMLFGIMCSACNDVYFRHISYFIAEFIPQILFFTSLFGYLVFLIFYKWIYISAHDLCAPSILLTFINMFFEFGKEIPDCERLYMHQEIVQMVLVIIAVVCVPWLLLTKPIVLIIKKKQKSRLTNAVSGNTGGTTDTEIVTVVNLVEDYAPTEESGVGEIEVDDCDKSIGEIVIMQMIHTIEFCLGCLSNLASYLRLWALSLAHMELSDLLWTMVFRPALKVNGYYGCIIIFFIIYIFLLLSFSILVVMEGLSTFLHAIRLHWVEFQNKFYSGTGHQHKPFTFRYLMIENAFS